MTRRERAAGGPSEITFEALTGLKLRPRAMREAAAMWDSITNEKGIEERDAMWSHPDLLPELPDFSEDAESNKVDDKVDEAKSNESNKNNQISSVTNKVESEITEDNDLEQKLKDVNWDDELSKLLESNSSSNPDDESDPSHDSNSDSESDSNANSESDSNSDSDSD